MIKYKDKLKYYYDYFKLNKSDITKEIIGFPLGMMGGGLVISGYEELGILSLLVSGFTLLSTTPSSKRKHPNDYITNEQLVKYK
jgi:hypothetical protein